MVGRFYQLGLPPCYGLDSADIPRRIMAFLAPIGGYGPFIDGKHCGGDR
jgi:hypothetical protein